MNVCISRNGWIKKNTSAALALISASMILAAIGFVGLYVVNTINREIHSTYVEIASLNREHDELHAAFLDVCAQAKRIGLSKLSADTANTLQTECPRGYFE